MPIIVVKNITKVKISVSIALSKDMRGRQRPRYKRAREARRASIAAKLWRSVGRLIGWSFCFLFDFLFSISLPLFSLFYYSRFSFGIRRAHIGEIRILSILIFGLSIFVFFYSFPSSIVISFPLSFFIFFQFCNSLLYVSVFDFLPYLSTVINDYFL